MKRRRKLARREVDKEVHAPSRREWSERRGRESCLAEEQGVNSPRRLEGRA
jgi:hypothetical protein